jgi:competence protein ComEA
MKYLIAASLLSLFSALAYAGPVNINTADARQIAKELQGIGPAKAAAIVAYRTEKGPFKSPEDLKKVEGIGEATYEANKANIRIKD